MSGGEGRQGGEGLEVVRRHAVGTEGGRTSEVGVEAER